MKVTLTPDQLYIAQSCGMTPAQFSQALDEEAEQAAIAASMPALTEAQVFAACGLAAQPAHEPASAAATVARSLAENSVGVCTFSLASLTALNNERVLIQATPAQDFIPSDGREMNVPCWRINEEIGRAVAARFNPEKPLVIDYEHQTMNAEKNGQPAPAAGWIHGLQWVAGKGLHVIAELTEKARQQIKAREYLYFSPVFEYHSKTGVIHKIVMGALTNNPAISGMKPLAV